MLKFKQFINEEYPNTAVIEIDSRWLENSLDAFNQELDTITAKPFASASVFLNLIMNTLNRRGMLLPQQALVNSMSTSAELVYPLGDTSHFLYIVFDTNADGYVDGYAQAVESDELQDLVDMDKAEMFARNPVKLRPSTFYAKRDDDSGNDSEY
jgi:hypothetical protein